MKHVAQAVLTSQKKDRVIINSECDPGESLVYQIRLKGHLGPNSVTWFEGLTITAPDRGETLLTGPVIDQAALFGVLRKVCNLGMSLFSVVCIHAC